MEKFQNGSIQEVWDHYKDKHGNAECYRVLFGKGRDDGVLKKIFLRLTAFFHQKK